MNKRKAKEIRGLALLHGLKRREYRKVLRDYRNNPNFKRALNRLMGEDNEKV